MSNQSKNTLIPLAVGVKAPDFKLQIGNGDLNPVPENFKNLGDYKGKNLILAFYPADWSAVCGSQIALYNELIPTFREYDAEIIGISVDGVFCHKAFKETNNMAIELLCDFEPKGKYSRDYKSYNEQLGLCERALYVIDKEGVIRYSYISPMSVNPGAKELLSTLKSIQNG